MERKLASIQKILKVEPIPDADNIEVATVLGWRSVVKKGEFKAGDLAVYIEYDSLLPERPEFEFMRPKKFRISTCRLRNCLSQGLCFPLSILGSHLVFEGIDLSIEGLDVTALLGIEKYEPPLTGNPDEQKGNFPQFIKKTDETRIQSVPGVLDRHRHRFLYMTEKLEGTNINFYYNNGEVGVCSRNMELKEVAGSKYWDTVKQYGALEKLRELGQNVALQGELVGEGIQGNHYKLRGRTIYLYTAFDINTFERLPLLGLQYLVGCLGMKTVPILDENFFLDHTVDDLLEIAPGKSVLADVEREGLVFRSFNYARDTELGDLSFKVISNKYLLKSSRD